jgi:hypothetical protein
MEERITYVGLDVHKEEIVAAVAEGRHWAARSGNMVGSPTRRAPWIA